VGRQPDVGGGWFDSHCHVQEDFTGNAGESGPEVLSRAAEAGIDRLVCIGTGVATSRQALDVARSTVRTSDRPGAAPLRAWASIGLHPHEASQGVSGVAELLTRELDANDDVVVAVGECGLDYYYEHSPRRAQREAFAEQIALAHAHDLALVIHARDAWDDLFDVLDGEGVPARTVLHCFTGGSAEIDRCLRAGMYVSFSGIITFKNAHDVRAAAERCPLDRLLVETDSPFLAPVPHRGHTNEPAFLPLVGESVAAVKSCTVEEVKERSAAAAAAVFSTGT
jgi:TatD DNase family protein